MESIRSPLSLVALVGGLLFAAVQSFSFQPAFRSKRTATHLGASKDGTDDSARRTFLLDTCAAATAFMPATSALGYADDENDFIVVQDEKELKIEAHRAGEIFWLESPERPAYPTYMEMMRSRVRAN